jgi:hypothetical protein
MKTLTTTIALLTLTFFAIAQRAISYGYNEIKKVQYDSCSKTQYLIINIRIKKQSGKLTIPISGKPSKVFKDDSSDENFHEFEYLGDIKGTKLSLVKRTGYNSEEFYLVNRLSGSTETLIGQPVFASNMKDFACLNNPGTDEEQRIQVCEINNGAVNTRVYLRGYPNTFIQDIGCVKRNSVLVKDNKGKYWRLSFKIEGE